MRTGASASHLGPGFRRWMRVCKAENGIGPDVSSCQASSSPSNTQSISSAAAAASTSGKRPSRRSSPLDQSATSPRRRISWARMPSHFHSISQSSMGPSPARSPSSGEARKNGYGCWRSPGSSCALSRSRRNAGLGAHAPSMRCAMRAIGTPDISASACCTMRCDTPTRSAPVSSLLNTRRSSKGRPSQAVTMTSRRSASSRLATGTRTSSIQSARPRSGAAWRGSGTSSARVSARSPTWS
ncbi:hypothetical protein D3C86_903780 [compost metagenome]